MASFQFKGIKEYAEMLQRLGQNTEEVCGAGVYRMAGVVADEVSRNIRNLNQISDNQALGAYQKQEAHEPSIAQKKGLLNSFGISTMRNENGYWHVKLGFDGYNDIKTKKYPQGQPNALIARSIESGSTAMKKQPFIRPAVKATEDKAVKEGKNAIEKKIKAIIE